MIRRAAATDAEAVARIEAESLGADAWSPALVTEGVEGRVPTLHYLVAATADHHPVGYAATSLAGDVADLQRIAVAAAHRRTGVASALLDGVLDLAASHGAERVLLEVREDNASARAFYAARGFAEIARRPRYYRDGTTALVLERRVTPA
jgi:ribosomal-protein-alanine N-acetyltransferase